MGPGRGLGPPGVFLGFWFVFGAGVAKKLPPLSPLRSLGVTPGPDFGFEISIFKSRFLLGSLVSFPCLFRCPIAWNDKAALFLSLSTPKPIA
jgi:hypothetical protein